MSEITSRGCPFSLSVLHLLVNFRGTNQLTNATFVGFKGERAAASDACSAVGVTLILLFASALVIGSFPANSVDGTFTPFLP